MPVYRLLDLPLFPPPELADETGLVAVGGDLSVTRLLMAYRQGIFPWYSDDQPILWWSPDPRLILEPDELRISHSLRKTLKKGLFEIRVDTVFPEVIRACAAPRADDDNTWITADMQRAYIRLHNRGYAHSIESWCGGELVGGLYGVSVGRAFFGESMFSRRTDASKAALAGLVALVKARGISLIDCQLPTPHLLSMGAKEMARDEFLRRLQGVVGAPTDRGRWSWPEGLSILEGARSSQAG